MLRINRTNASQAASQAQPTNARKCANCSARESTDLKLRTCDNCKVTPYCSDGCRVANLSEHINSCSYLKLIGEQSKTPTSTGSVGNTISSLREVSSTLEKADAQRRVLGKAVQEDPSSVKISDIEEAISTHNLLQSQATGLINHIDKEREAMAKIKKDLEDIHF